MASGMPAFMFDEPAPYALPALEALEIWVLMGHALRIEAFEAACAFINPVDPDLTIALLREIAGVMRRAGR